MAIIEREEQFFDVRLVERLMKKGLVKQKDYDKYLKNLADVEDEGEFISDDAISLDETQAKCQKNTLEDSFDSEDSDDSDSIED